MGTDDKKKQTPGIDWEKRTISFDYLKGNNFRVIHVSGVIGGPAPRPGIIHMSVFNERLPIPKRTVSQFSAEGEIGKEILGERITRDAIVREVEALLVMDIEVATRVRDWLDDKIKKIQKVIKTKETSKTIPEGKD